MPKFEVQFRCIGGCLYPNGGNRDKKAMIKGYGWMQIWYPLARPPAKLLIPTIWARFQEPVLTPCNYQRYYCRKPFHFFAHFHGVDWPSCSGNDPPIFSRDLEIVETMEWESDADAENNEGLAEVLIQCMHNPPSGARYMRYLGSTVKAESGIVSRKKRFVHYISFLRPTITLPSELHRLVKEMSHHSVHEYLRQTRQPASAFECVPVELREDSRINPWGTDPQQAAKKRFVQKAPPNAEHIADVRISVTELPGVTQEGKPYQIMVTGTALVPKVP